MSTPTPRTDAEASRMRVDCDDSCVDIYILRDDQEADWEIVLASFSRELESALIEIRTLLENQPPPRPGEFHWPLISTIVERALSPQNHGR